MKKKFMIACINTPSDPRSMHFTVLRLDMWMVICKNEYDGDIACVFDSEELALAYIEEMKFGGKFMLIPFYEKA